jgi:hypothetical protein
VPDGQDDCACAVCGEHAVFTCIPPRIMALKKCGEGIWGLGWHAPLQGEGDAQIQDTEFRGTYHHSNLASG